MKKLFCLLFLTFALTTFVLQAQFVSSQQNAQKAEQSVKAKPALISPQILYDNLEGTPVAKSAIFSPKAQGQKIKLQAEVNMENLPTVSYVKPKVAPLGQVVQENRLQARAPKAGPAIRLGGYSVFLDGSNLGSNDIFSFYNYTFGDKSTAAVLPSPIFGLGSGAGWGVGSSYSAGVRCAAWNGKELIGQVVLFNNSSGGVAYTGPYVKYEPISQKMTNIGAGTLAFSPQQITYNSVSNKIFALDAAYILYSNSGEDVNFVKIDTLKLNGEVFTNLVKAIATNSFGNTYIIANEGTTAINLFRLNTTTAALTLVGKLGITPNAYMESATFDVLTNTLYYENSGINEMICTVDTLTGKATMVDNIGSETVALFHHYYTNPPPGTPTDFMVTKNPANYKELTLSWKNPTLDYNGNPLTQGLTKLYIYRGATIATMEKIDSIANPVVGASLTHKITEKQDGEVYFGIQVVASIGTSAILASDIIFIYPPKPLPWETSFEDPLGVGIEARGVLSQRVDTLPYTGNKAWSLAGANTSYLEISPIPIKKGAQYKISFMGRLSRATSGLNNFSYFINGNGYYKAITSATYTKYEILYTGLESKESTLSFASMNATGDKIIDDVKVEVLVPETIPGAIDSISSIVANPNGELKYSVTWYNPSLDAEGKTLASLSHIVVQRATVSSISPLNASYATDTIATTVVGGKVTMEFTVPLAGKYYFRFTAKNADGFSAVYYTSTVSGYAGKDTVPAAVTNLVAQANNDGTVKVSFKHSGGGVNEGYWEGNITKYMVIRTPYFASTGATPIADTSYVTQTNFNTPVLPLGYYSFKVAAIRNDLNAGGFTTAYSVGGTAISQNKILCQNGEVITAISTSIYPLGFSSAANNSIISHVVYTPAEMGGAFLIDSLYFFAQNYAGAHYQKIYMGYKSDTMFTSTSDFADISKMRLVYDDTIKSVNNSNVIAIKVSPFSYDGKQPLVIAFTKPLQPRTSSASAPAIIQMPATNKMLSATSTSLDFSEGPPATGIRATTRPITVVNKVAASANIGGVIKNSRGAVINNASVEFKVGEEVYTTTVTSADGKYLVHLPANTYKIRVSSIMMAEYTAEFTLTQGQNMTKDITLSDAGKISLTGFVKNYKNELMEGVAIAVVGDTTYKIVSNAQGKFVIDNIYGATTYKLTAKKTGYINYTQDVKLLEVNFELDTIKMDFDPLPVERVLASQTNNIATITWSNFGGAKLLSWCKDSTGTNSIGAGGGKILIAQTFSVADLSAAAGAAVGTIGKITKVKFKTNDVTASFTLKIFQGTNPVETSAIYTQEIGKVANGSHEITLTTPCVVDASKDLYIAFDIAAGYTGYPMGCDEGPIVPGKGGRTYSSGSWIDLPASLPYNWNIYTTLSIEVPNNPVGYHVYRGASGSESSVDTWTKLNTSMLTANTYTDNTFAALPFGQYKYAVKADWMNNNLSPAAISNVLNKDMEFKVDAQVNTNGAPKTGAKVVLTNVNGSAANVYTITAPASGLATFPKVWRGVYNVAVTLPGHNAVEIKNVNIARDTNLALPSLMEIIANPRIIDAKVTDNNVLMDWSILSEGDWMDNFESYEDFAIANIGNYTLSAPVNKGGMQGVTWPNYDEKQSYIVMNSGRTTPSITANHPAYSGDKFIASWFAEPAPNNDWLIKSISATEGGKISFYARGLGYGGVQETFRVLASSKTSATADFVKLHTNASILATTTWTLYTYDVPAGSKFIAINCNSNDLFGFFVDDLSFSSAATAVPKSYEIYLNGTKVADTLSTVSKYLYRNLNPGTHTLGIKAIFYSGASTLVTKEVTISSVTKPITPSVSMVDGNAVFTWDIPSGYAPTSYEVYLDGTKVTDVTAKTYTFVAPAIGNHTAGVIAVFGSDKSAMTTANFKVLRIDDFAANAGINVYPNPSSTGHFNLSVASSYDVSILQYNGKVVMTKKVNAGENLIDLSNQPQGVYFIKLTSAKGTYTVKIVK